MGKSQGPGGETMTTESDRTPEQVREDIERTRAEMGDTVAQLAAKTDIKAQAHRAVDTAKATVASKASGPVVSRAQDHRLALIAVGAFGAGLLIGKRRA
jgi:UTP:GlnB (protein PII) uridylyltransferase